MSISTSIEISEAQLEAFFILVCSDRMSLKYVASQVRMNSGIADVICRQSQGVYYVVELKAEPLQSKHLAQVLGYVCELRARHPEKIIKPLLIGPDINEGHLSHCLRWYDEFPGEFGDQTQIPSVCEYRLYDFDAVEGLNFWGYGVNQRNGEASRGETLSARYSQLAEARRRTALKEGIRNISAWRRMG